MRKNRFISFILVLLAYLVAGVCGIIIFNYLPFSYYLNLLVADIISTTIIFIFSLIYRNASTYDPYWSVAPIVISIGLLLSKEFNVVNLLIMIPIFLWGVRLTINWMYTFKNLDHQDWRYIDLKEKSKKLYPLVNYLGIHMFPTLVVYSCMLPVIFCYYNPVTLNISTLVFSLLAIGSFILETISDLQMQEYRKNKTTPFIRVGLWKYCRHPNYLGEISFWWFIGLASVLSMNNHYYLLFGALINTLMFIFISIPMADKRQAKKEGYSEYKDQTRSILPIYKKVK